MIGMSNIQENKWRGKITNKVFRLFFYGKNFQSDFIA